jgi:AraC-like DNA-binding protein
MAPDQRPAPAAREGELDPEGLLASLEVMLRSRTTRDRAGTTGLDAGATTARARAVREHARAAQARAATLQRRVEHATPRPGTAPAPEREDPRRRVNRAVGLLMLTFGVDAERSAGCLTLLARHHRVTVDEIAHLLVAGALTDDEQTPPREDASAGEPAVLRQALAFIHRHAAEPIGVGEIAEAVAISTRELQRTFRRHRGTTPLSYLRRTRLEGAHLDLRAADPLRGDTVASIASRWGFGHPGRFSIAYQEHFEQPPSHTLRTAEPAGSDPARPPGP